VSELVADAGTAGVVHAHDLPPFAGFWRRFAAYLIDAVLLGAVEAALTLTVAVADRGPGGVGSGAAAEVVPVSAVIAWAYFAIMESSPAQATVGKIALGIKVTDGGGGPISFRRAAARYALKALSTLTFGIGWLLVLVTPHKQALHDLLAGTLVVRTEFTPATTHWDPAVLSLRHYWDGRRWLPPRNS
jgi:uncharacterized RDD family membrane protein YckC